jgi:predicted metal-dependent hydrolase
MNAPLKKSSITVRRMDFSFSDIPRYWFNDDVLVTHLLNAMSVTFPEGERFFVESVRAFREGISDPVLQKEVSAFIGQEAMHAKEHNTFNRYLEGLGLDVATIEANTLSNINRTRESMTPAVKLAITCALEHFTAILAEQMLGNPELMAGMDPHMLKLWAWHAIEETEHKGVAFDVFQSQVGDDEMRRRVMRRVTFFFIMRNSYFTGRLLYEDGKLFSPKVWYKGIKTLWGKKGLLRGMLSSYMEYYDRDFHPWQRDSRAMVEQWKQKLGLDKLPEPAKPVAENVPVAAAAIVVDAAPKPARKPRAGKPKTVEAADLTDAITPKPKRAPRRKTVEPEPKLH